MSDKLLLVSFDEYGTFDLSEPGLIEFVSVEGLPISGGDNAACYNGFCLNDVCVRYGTSNAVCLSVDPPPVSPPPVHPPSLNLRCWQNQGCPLE